MDIKEFLKNKKTYVLSFLLSCTFLLSYNIADAATLQINSSAANISVGDTATLYISLNSEGVAVNNADATIKFPSDQFDVLSISKTGSVFSLWVEEPSFSNSNGQITFNGGIPTPGFMGNQGSVVSVVVRAKSAGQGEFSFADAAVRANDGLGTNVLSSSRSGFINVAKKAEAKAVVPSVTPAVTKPTKAKPTEVEETSTPAVSSSKLELDIFSETHPDQNLWYSDNEPTFDWELPSGVDSVRASIGRTATGNPTITYNPAITTRTSKDLADGVWYFKTRARKSSVWGPVSTYVVKIDTTAPNNSAVDFVYNDASKVLTISSDASDTTSGIDYYEVYINDTLIKKIPTEEIGANNYEIPITQTGDNTARFIAFDKAGNSTESSWDFNATGSIPPVLEPILSMYPANEQVLVRGTTQDPNTPVIVYFKNGDEEPVAYKTKSDSENSFWILTSKLRTGTYDVWAETGAGKNTAPSAHLHTKVTADLFVKVGQYTIPALAIVIPASAAFLLVIAAFYYLGHYFGRLRRKQKVKIALIRKDSLKILLVLRRRLERHLEVLHETRHERLLTKEEKEIKDDIEEDLDEIDWAIEEHRAKQN